jgi:hypothetical protein
MADRVYPVSTKVGQYRGIDIFTYATEKNIVFFANVGKQRFTGPSFESLTKKLDPAIGFEARDVLHDGGRHHGIQQVRIIGQEKSAYGMKFVREDGERGAGSYYALEARPLLEELHRLNAEADALKDDYEAKRARLYEKLNELTVKAD